MGVMPSSSSSSAQAARQRLADQLRELRTAAGISGVEFARRAGWRDSTNISKIERAVRPASAEHVRLWCGICGASEQRLRELLAEQASVERMWLTYRQLNRGGLKGAQESVRDRYERVKLMRTYCTHVVPGLLQTRAYTAAALESVRIEQHVEVDDVAAAVDERMERQRVLRRPDARFVFLLEEQVLHHRVVPAHVHAEQLSYLLAVARLPSVSLGIIPLHAERALTGHRVWPEHTFVISDAELVTVELVSGFLSVSEPAEIADYVAAWERLFGLAVHGEKVRQIITGARDRLDA
ncbi:helix-turn-helix domain-containing protein [Actinomadura bangladeshensis]|uniref:Helix-turn-helix domain-containing protein n=1 Tax=Actinomadura bangladeshensis TaxID=453573 RepID=A0A6L9QE56_9ACTN|nr:helix-turn-helix transcriptional regulator [Actinomadura bangladeshensis]NEA23777.1 helix-turn-helix domain-containing protein [Actinomadura bangladeshensis]